MHLRGCVGLAAAQGVRVAVDSPVPGAAPVSPIFASKTEVEESIPTAFEKTFAPCMENKNG